MIGFLSSYFNDYQVGILELIQRGYTVLLKIEELEIFDKGTCVKCISVDHKAFGSWKYEVLLQSFGLF